MRTGDVLDIPQLLHEKLKQEKVVLFLGAGLSIESGYPNWYKLIEVILDGLKDKENKIEAYKDALKSEILSPIEILGKLEKYREDIIETLDKELSSHNDSNPTIIHEKLKQLSKKIITTNYDCLIEKANVDFEKITYSNTYKISKLSEYEKYIFKIHGDINEPDKCILFPSDYVNLYSTEQKSSVFELKKIISDKSILFIGFSMNDPYISYVFDFINKLYSGFSPEHFIITNSKEDEWPSRITPVYLEHYSELSDLFDVLISEKNSTSNTDEIIINELKADNGNVNTFSKNLEYDLPPLNKYWVGRTDELRNISSDIFKVIFITGIGGQGKSALASHYLSNNFDHNIYEFGDWRDFKEETNRFQTKIISIIHRLTENIDHQGNLNDLDNNDLVDLLFQYLGDRKIVFVFDNIDSYIDLESFKPIGGFEYLYKKALNIDHKSKFIFTCRPFIREASLNFYQISLDGLSLKNSEELFNCYNISLKEDVLKQLVNKVHQLTKGHPLWLNLIAAQAVRGIQTVNSFIKSIENKTKFDEKDFSSILSEKILDEVWESLNQRQKNLLRGIAETVKPETEESLKKILSSEFNNNHFNKAFRALKSLNLVEIKSSSISEDQIELHPLVKDYIMTKYPRSERAKFITLFVNYYDSFIYILKPKLSSDLSLSSFQNWTSKIELQINKGDYKPSLVSLEEISFSILTAGYTEEYLRVAEILFNNINWEDAIGLEYPYFHSQFTALTNTLIKYGKNDLCNKYLYKYSKLIPGKSTHYLSYCSLKCYFLWYLNNFEAAIQIGEEGIYLLNESNLTDTYSLMHNLALALRDSKIVENVHKSLEYFLMNNSIEDVLDYRNRDDDRGGHFYGNIGKCLEYLDRNDDALFCYFISLEILEKEKHSDSDLNLSYAYSWISEILFKKGLVLESIYFLKLGIFYCKKISPPRVKMLSERLQKIQFDKDTILEIEKLPMWKLQKTSKDIIKRQKIELKISSTSTDTIEV
jgi:hypothetical protein